MGDLLFGVLLGFVIGAAVVFLFFVPLKEDEGEP